METLPLQCISRYLERWSDVPQCLSDGYLLSLITGGAYLTGDSRVNIFLSDK